MNIVKDKDMLIVDAVLAHLQLLILPNSDVDLLASFSYIPGEGGGITLSTMEPEDFPIEAKYNQVWIKGDNMENVVLVWLCRDKNDEIVKDITHGYYPNLDNDNETGHAFPITDVVKAATAIYDFLINGVRAMDDAE